MRGLVWLPHFTSHRGRAPRTGTCVHYWLRRKNFVLRLSRLAVEAEEYRRDEKRVLLVADAIEIMQDYQNLPIDIQTSKLLDIHYFHCLRIVEILKRTEASTKNIFGRYSSQRMKDWQEIVALYEKDNTYLVELASLLVRNVSYEIPSLKKQISKCQQLQQEYSRKEEECQLAAAEMRERFCSSCKQYGIAGDDIRRELLALVKDLPSQLDEIGAGAKGLLEAIDLYQACVQFVCDGSTEQVVPLLRHVQAQSNTTVYEWRRGVKPVLVERPKTEEGKETVNEEAIDWGDFRTESASFSEATDYGISVEGASEEIDWGISLEPEVQESSSSGIDWGDRKDDVAQIVSEAPEGVAQGPDALTLLETPETRNQFIDELMELEIFLSQRIAEMSEEADILSVSQFQRAPPILQDQTKEKLEAMMADIQNLIGRLTNLRMQHLFMILASPRYVDRVTELLHQKLKQADLLLLKKEVMVQKQKEALEEQANLEPKLDLLVEKTRDLQKLIEADISKRYSGRPVNLMGASL
ncbi:CDK5 regulatory subunit-associated protein 3 isoform X2 [Candoia aspera]|uniref:CDK5 regulatory subunit-associated protein 3 isoform X2 n=1 Tax=Candoia aspera TaxID=51853 RepID=UPI002FD7D83E